MRNSTDIIDGLTFLTAMACLAGGAWLGWGLPAGLIVGGVILWLDLHLGGSRRHAKGRESKEA